MVMQSLPEVHDHRSVQTTRAGLPLDEVVRDAAEVFQALANPVRIRIMHALTHRELCVGDLARALDLRMSALSHQLAVLRRLKLIAARENGRQTFYRVINDFVGEVVHDCLAHVEGRAKASRRGHRHPHRAHR
jgi:ArsR family transcriptional regulator, lead/cadmium/zinc/bismuth-responsive transcriptional repressor